MSKIKELIEKAALLDGLDPLAGFRHRFAGDDQLIYLDGNSLGRVPVETVERMQKAVNEQWGQRLIRGWNEYWLDLPKRLAAKLAKIVGASENEIFVGDSTSINLYKLAYGVLKLQQGRTEILSDDLNFPSDFYVIQGLINSHFHQHRLTIFSSPDGIHAPLEQLEASISSNTALVCISHVAFKSAFMYDMARLNQLAGRNGARIIWDLSHSGGSVPLKLNDWGAELAVGCTYKYLNGGPGAPAFLYVRSDLQPMLENAIWAWFGHARPFQFEHQYEALEGIWKYSAGTPPVLSMTAIEPGLDLILEAGIDILRAKSLSLSTYFRELFQLLLEPLGFGWASPLEPDHRGSHVSITYPEAYRICKALISPMNGNKPVIPDFRKPDNIRLGFAPLSNTHAEVAEAVLRIEKIVKSGVYLKYDPTLEAVT